MQEHVSRLQSRYEEGIRELQVKQTELQKFKDDYRELDNTLAHLLTKTRHSVMVPMGSEAFMSGYIKNTNSLTVLLGDNYFVERTVRQSRDIIRRRFDWVKDENKRAQEQIDVLKANFKASSMLLEGASASEAEFGTSVGPDGTVEIREEYVSDDEEKAVSRPPMPKETAQTRGISQETLDELRLLQEQEEAEEELEETKSGVALGQPVTEKHTPHIPHTLETKQQPRKLIEELPSEEETIKGEEDEEDLEVNVESDVGDLDEHEEDEEDEERAEEEEEGDVEEDGEEGDEEKEFEQFWTTLGNVSVADRAASLAKEIKNLDAVAISSLENQFPFSPSASLSSIASHPAALALTSPSESSFTNELDKVFQGPRSAIPVAKKKKSVTWSKGYQGREPVAVHVQELKSVLKPSPPSPTPLPKPFGASASKKLPTFNSAFSGSIVEHDTSSLQQPASKPTDEKSVASGSVIEGNAGVEQPVSSRNIPLPDPYSDAATIAEFVRQKKLESQNLASPQSRIPETVLPAEPVPQARVSKFKATRQGFAHG